MHKIKVYKFIGFVVKFTFKVRLSSGTFWRDQRGFFNKYKITAEV